MFENDINLTIKQVINKYELLKNKTRSKSLGQHFLCDSTLLEKIVSCAIPFDGCDIVEIGPGPCGLTRAILKSIRNDQNLYCIEKDENLKNVHENLSTNYANLNFIYSDALCIRPQDLSDKNIIIISNLPYNVGTQLLINWLLDLKGIEKFILMFQKEVAQRICAKQNTKEYGRLSILSQLFCHTEKLFDISNKAFYPAPKVTSTVIKLTPKKTTITNIKNLEKLTALCFQHRRKTIFSILKKVYSNTELTLENCKIEKLARPENISPIQFLELSKLLVI